MGTNNQALIISTSRLPGFDQMNLDLHYLEETFNRAEILFTLRFYFWEGDWLSLGYHQKSIPANWEKLSKEGHIKIVRRPSGGGAVLHSGWITYALTFKKNSYNRFSYETVNNWLIQSLSKLGLNLEKGNLKKSTIKDHCFGSSYICDLVDEFGFKRVGSAQYRKNGVFLQHGEIQLNPCRELWKELFEEEAPPQVKLNRSNDEIINYLKNRFIEGKPNLKIQNINCKYSDIKNLLKN